MKEKEKIVVIGSYAVGMTIRGNHFPKPGETVAGHDFQAMKGGKGSNQAIAASRLGASVCFGTCIGDDQFGKDALVMYEKEHIDFSHVRKSSEGLSTGVGLIYVNDSGENEIIIDFAANMEYNREDIDAMMPLICDSKLVLMQLECDLDIVIYTAQKCKEAGITFVLNPAPYVELPNQLLKNCTYLIPNQTEARQILKLNKKEHISDEEVAERLYDLGVENVILTLGDKGAYIRNSSTQRFVSGHKVDTVDTTGAGDTFIGAFCVALAEGKNLIEAVEFGNKAAAISVTNYGVIDAIPTREEVENFCF